MIQSFVCGHLLVASAEAKCELARGYPSECLGCSAYLPGQTLDDRLRRDAWQHVLDRMPAPSRAEIEEIRAELDRQDKVIQELARRLAHLLERTRYSAGKQREAEGKG